MKYIYLPLLVFSLLATSCSDFLDREPSTALLDSESITSLNDLQNAVNGVYYLNTTSRMSYGGDFAIYADMKSGDLYPKGENNHIKSLSSYQTGITDIMPEYAWYYMYKSIANINQALNQIQTLVVEEDEAEEVKYLTGELYALRAMFHFDLARIYSQIPTAVDNIDAANSGIAVSDEVYAPDYRPARNTLRETYDQILKDLGTALPLMTDAKTPGHINYWGALALRARVNLYYGKDADALSDAQNVITNSPYTLYTRNDYTDVWDQAYTAESLLEITITTNYNAQRNSAGYYTSANGYGEAAINEDSELFAYLTTTPEDIRSEMIEYQTGTYPGYYPLKYPGRGGEVYVNNPKLIRLSDVYLIAAEAALKTGGDAAFYINALRANRIENYQPVASVTLEEILFERRVELFAENSTSFDYFRNRMSVTTPLAGTIPYNHTRTIFPIPLAELEANPNMIQNPGYGSIDDDEDED
ncbi:MAG: RagB/SusD family nutrient uptake outer membrane protein [Tannerellaceae bacterium]|nr:RagB/SusD family nutrient uptake outer membrane protein [Tannerellaceae bacterium]